MTKGEFNVWLEFHTELFPEVGEWFEAHGNEHVLNAWREALEDVLHEDAMACSKRMVAGLAEHPNRFEISRLPAAIVRQTPYRVLSAEKLKGKRWNPTTGDVV